MWQTPPVIAAGGFFMQSNRFLGGTLIVAGTAIGGGMLALPLVSAFAGYMISLIVLVFMWALMTYTALITLEMNLYFKKGASIALAAEHTLGKAGKLISSTAIGLLFFALLSAYMSGGASILKAILRDLTGSNLSESVITVIFGLVFSGVIFARTQIVDTTNRIFLLIKIALFIAIVASIIPEIDYNKLSYVPEQITYQQWALVPLFFTSFGFHGSIPSVINYVGLNPRRLTLTFLVGSSIPLLIYIIWETVSLGSIPIDGPYGFMSIKSNGGDVGCFVKSLSTSAGGGWINLAAQIFTLLAIVTSFLGVGLGLFDFMEEQFSKEKNIQRPTITWAQTFIIPFVFALFYPQGFSTALGYAAIALSFLAVIIPSLAVWKLRRKQKETTYVVWGGTPGIVLALLCGLTVIVIEIMTMLI